MKKTKRLLALLLTLTLSLSLFAGCGGEKEDDGKYLIGVSQPTMTHPIRVTGNVIIDDWKKDHPNVEIVVTDGQLNATKQISDIEDLIARKADIILVAAHQSDTLVGVLQQAKDAEIPVIAFDRSLTDESVQVSKIINDDVTAGETGLEILVDGMGESGKIAILQGSAGGAVTIARDKGFKGALEAYPNIEVVADLTANFQRVQAVTIFEDIIQTHPDLNAVFCHNDEMALGVASVLENRGITDVVVVGIDGQKDALEAIMAGTLYGTVRKVVEMEYALDYALQYLETGSCPEELILHSARVDSTNVEEFYDENAIF